MKVLRLAIVLAACFGLGASFGDPPTAAELVRRGIELLKSGDAESALAKFRDAQVEDPASAIIHYDVGLALYALERWDEALTSFTQAGFAADKAIEKMAALQRGNCLVKQGKLEGAVDAYNRALELDPEFEDAKVNREWVVRKLKELARKQKEEDEKKEQQKQIAEKLREILEGELMLHGATRATMLKFAMSVPDSRLQRFAEALAIELPEDEKAEKPAPEVETQALDEVGKRQADLLEKLRALLEEARAKVEAPPPAADPHAPPAPGGDTPPPDPEVEKLKKALPHMAAAEPAMDHAREGAVQRREWPAVHAGEEESLAELVKALDELLDELTRIIQDQVQVMKDTAALISRQADPDENKRPGDDERRDRGVELGEREKGLEKRCTAFAKGVEQAVDEGRRAADPSAVPSGSGGPDPQAAAERQAALEKALGHLNRASAALLDAAKSLGVPDLATGAEHEKTALEALIQAKAALSPPPQGKDGGDQQEKQEKKESEQQDEEKKDPQSDPGQKDQQDQQKAEEAKDQKLSEEQKQKTLEQAEQRERDKRKEAKAKGRSTGSAKGKDW